MQLRQKKEEKKKHRTATKIQDAAFACEKRRRLKMMMYICDGEMVQNV